MADVELLQAEIEALRAKTARTMGVGTGDGKLFVHGDYESIKAAQEIVLERDALRAEVVEWKRVAAAQAGLHGEAEARAERLEEALEEIRSRSTMNLAMQPDPFELTAELGNIHQIADAALAQEDRND